jgi:hypothetical protein
MKVTRFLLATAWPLVLFAASVVADDAANGPAASKADNSFVARPYLQLGRSPAQGTLQLLWHAVDSGAEWSVEVQAAAGRPWVKTEPPVFRRVAVAGIEPHRVYRATLSELVPGGLFRYQVSLSGQPVFTCEGRATKSAKQAYRFVAFGDCGAGSNEQKPLAYRAFLSQPDFVLIPGDIVYEHGLISEYREKFWPVYNTFEATDSGAPLLCSTPFIAAPGNHDIDTRNLDRFPDALAYYLYWDQPLNGPLGQEGSAFVPPLVASEANRHAFTQAAGPSYPRMSNFSFDYGNAHWTILDSNPYVDWTDRALKEWVETDLAVAQNATWRFVVFHHPGFNSSRAHYAQQQMRLLAPVFEAGKVDVVWSGHVHNYQRSFPLRFVPDGSGTTLVGGRESKTVRGRVVNGQWTLDKSFDGRTDTTPEGVIYVITGAGGQKLYNPEQQDDPDSWQKFTDKFISKVHSLTVADVEGKTLTVRQVGAEGQELDRFTVTK